MWYRSHTGDDRASLVDMYKKKAAFCSLSPDFVRLFVRFSGSISPTVTTPQSTHPSFVSILVFSHLVRMIECLLDDDPNICSRQIHRYPRSCTIYSSSFMLPDGTRIIYMMAYYVCPEFELYCTDPSQPSHNGGRETTR